MQLVTREMEGVDSDDFFGKEKAGDIPIPLCNFFPAASMPGVLRNGCLRKLKEIQDCLGISREGFEDQFRP